MQTMTTPADRILDAIRTVTAYYRADWASLSAVRDESALPRKVFDATMLELAYAGRVVLVPEDNQKTLTRAEEYNALYIGGEDKHLAQIADDFAPIAGPSLASTHRKWLDRGLPASTWTNRPQA